MSTAAKVIEIATKELGTVEGPKNNETKYGKFTKADLQPWCGSFIMWVAHQANLAVPNCVYTPAGASAFKAAKQWKDATVAKPQPGWVAFFDFPGDGVKGISHVGWVVKDNGDGTVTTIEGNTSPENKRGSQSNGGQVAQRIRAFQSNKRGLPVTIVGFGIPKFSSD